MESGNSASLQSSSGAGDDEFDSRCGADSSPLSALLQQPPSVPGFGGVGGGTLIYGLQELRTPPLSSHWCTTTAPLPVPAGAQDAAASPPTSLPDQADAAPAQAHAAAPRGSTSKRARASRRAPTTVLTTDTSNFRAMVQEFTGIPSPPFAGAAPASASASAFARSRFEHLFPLRAHASSTATLPQYLLRPFAHKLHASSSTTGPYPPTSVTSSPAQANVSIAPAASTATTPGTTTAVAASSDSYHQLAAAASTTSALLGMQQDHSHSSSRNYHSFHHQSSSLGDANYAAPPAFDRSIAPPPDFLGLTHQHDDVTVGSQGPHAHLGFHPLLVGGAPSVVTGAGGCCKATYSSTRPLLERSPRNPSPDVCTAATTSTVVAATAAAGMRTQAAGVVDSWVCSSD